MVTLRVAGEALNDGYPPDALSMIDSVVRCTMRSEEPAISRSSRPRAHGPCRRARRGQAAFEGQEPAECTRGLLRGNGLGNRHGCVLWTPAGRLIASLGYAMDQMIDPDIPTEPPALVRKDRVETVVLDLFQNTVLQPDFLAQGVQELHEGYEESVTQMQREIRGLVAWRRDLRRRLRRLVTALEDGGEPRIVIARIDRLEADLAEVEREIARTRPASLPNLPSEQEI